MKPKNRHHNSANRCVGSACFPDVGRQLQPCSLHPQMALGWGGQFVIRVPVLDLVVATNASWQIDAAAADAQERAILTVVVEELLPLIPIRHRQPRRPAGRVRTSVSQASVVWRFRADAIQ